MNIEYSFYDLLKLIGKLVILLCGMDVISIYYHFSI